MGAGLVVLRAGFVVEWLLLRIGRILLIRFTWVEFG